MTIQSCLNQPEPYVQRLKIAVIREELVVLTGDTFRAVVLNQFIYWSERIRDYDQFVIEEQQRQPESVSGLRHGWIYKRAYDLIAETMLSISENTMRRIIKDLVTNGWLSERTNPDNKWDKVLQYRTNIVKIQYDLQQLGYGLNGFKLLTDYAHNSAAATNNIHEPILAPSQFQVTETKRQSTNSKLHFEDSKPQKSCFSSEIITKITPEISSSADNSVVAEEEVSIKMVKIWNATLDDQVSTEVHTARQQCLKQVLANVFAGDLQAWLTFCQQVAHTPFLRGQGPNGWKARLDWCLSDDKAQRILEGQYAHCWQPEGLLASAKEQNNEAELLQQCQTALATEGDHMVRAFKQQLLADNGPVIYQRWFQDLQLDRIDDQTLTLSHPRPYSRQQCQQRFQLDLLRVAQLLWPQIDKVQVGVPQQADSIIGVPPCEPDSTIDKLGPEHSGHPVTGARL